MPNVRAAVTPKFKSIADIQANKHRIVSKEEFEIAKILLKRGRFISEQIRCKHFRYLRCAMECGG